MSVQISEGKECVASKHSLLERLKANMKQIFGKEFLGPRKVNVRIFSRPQRSRCMEVTRPAVVHLRSTLSYRGLGGWREN